jgi:hypothetical protein
MAECLGILAETLTERLTMDLPIFSALSVGVGVVGAAAVVVDLPVGPEETKHPRKNHWRGVVQRPLHHL